MTSPIIPVIPILYIFIVSVTMRSTVYLVADEIGIPSMIKIDIRPLFVGFMFFIRKFPGWYAGGWVITITHYTHFKFLLSKFSQIMAKIIIMNVGIDKTFLKFKFSQEIINNGEKCG